MNNQFKKIFNKVKLNFAVLASILTLAVLGKITNPEITNSIFQTADQLVSDLILLFVAITLGAFIPNFKLVVFGAIAAFIAAAIAIQSGIFTYLTLDYLFAVLIVVLGFASIANLYKHYREVQF
jgi:membrane protease YdiL (CAAX protease family)